MTFPEHHVLFHDDRLLSTLERVLSIRELELQPALNRASTLLSESLGADKVDVFLYQAEKDTLVALGTSDTPMGRRQHQRGLDCLPLANGGRMAEVYQTGAPFLIGQADQDPHELKGITEGLGVRSEAICPVQVDDERRGVLSAVCTAADRFAERDMQFLEAVAGWLGVIIHRAELVEQIRRDAVQQGRQAAGDELGQLTRRQQEIAALIAEGLTSDEIAQRLVLATGTVSNHLEHIMTRLQLRNRAQLAVWAVEHGLYRSGQPEDEPGTEARAPTGDQNSRWLKTER
jgi:DNA-binding CsgD family transcriptional regulator